MLERVLGLWLYRLVTSFGTTPALCTRGTDSRYYVPHSTIQAVCHIYIEFYTRIWSCHTTLTTCKGGSGGILRDCPDEKWKDYDNETLGTARHFEPLQYQRTLLLPSISLCNGPKIIELVLIIDYTIKCNKCFILYRITRSDVYNTTNFE